MPRAGLTTDAVIDVAVALADKEGVTAVTLARLSEDLGVKPPSLYKHVDGLAAVQKALALRGLEEARRRLQRAAVGRARDEALFAVAYAYWQFARERPGLYTASLRAARPGEPEVTSAATALIEIMLAVLAGYGVEGDDALHATRGFRAIIHGFVSLDAAGGFQLALDLEESFARLIRAFARDLAGRGQIGNERGQRR
jgi:AcrR family transcriptional regulator